jgi:hypothetical protein
MASRSHRKSHRRSSKNIVSQTVSKGFGLVKSTSNKYAPKVKSGLQNIGSKVIKTGQQTVPYLQSLTRKAFGVGRKAISSVGLKSKKHRRRHR